jgi:5'-phosphate synthase pdxT subunit
VSLVRKPADLDGLDAIVLPGGESTAMLHAIERDGLEAPLIGLVASGARVLATCAGAILLARRVTNPAQRSFGVLDADVERNAYGTQLDSFAAFADPDSGFAGLRCTFIRAPRFVRLGPRVEVLARVRDDPVLVRCGAVWAATFHPELGEDDRVVRAWLA